MSANHFQKLTSIYLRKFFQKKNLPHQEWKVINKGSVHTVDNECVIRSILAADSSEQKLIADSLRELDDQGADINVFLKQLAKQSYILQ